MNIQETAAAIRAKTIEIHNTRDSQHARLTWLNDVRHDLQARHKMLLRIKKAKEIN